MNKALMSVFTRLWLFSEYGFAPFQDESMAMTGNPLHINTSAARKMRKSIVTPPKNELGISPFSRRRADWRTAMSGVSQAPNGRDQRVSP